jgi:UDP-glucose 4-epimerase
MSLDDAVDLVLYAFQHARQGDIFVQKAPASTILDLAQALKELFDADSEISIIGTRHGEKLYETLLTREELSNAEDLGGYFRIVPDERDLNYGKYFSEGEVRISRLEDYNSHNTQRLTIPEIKEKLLGLEFIQQELRGA